MTSRVRTSMRTEAAGERYVKHDQDHDQQLVAAALHDAARFEDIYQYYAHRIYRYALSRVRSIPDAEDLTSATMLAAFESLGRYDPARGRLGSWLFTIAVRRIADYERERSRRTTMWRHLTINSTIGEPDTLAAGVEHSEAMEYLQSCIAKLPVDDRQILLLRYAGNLTSPEIGEVLRMSDSAVRMRLMRIIRRLREELARCG